VDADELAKARALFAALPQEVQDGIAALAGEDAGRAALEPMLAPFGLTLEDIDEMVAASHE
jgi:hypothetical protein